LWRQLPKERGRKPEIPVAAHGNSETPRQQAKREAGLSDHQVVQVNRGGNVPEKEFKTLVESD
jgi:hypothetical protein